MSRIAYIDHSYHKKTKSTDFILEILTSHGHKVDRFWDESWNHGDSVNFHDVKNYDAVILFQIPPEWPGVLYKLHPNITYIPMLDGLGYTRNRQFGGVAFWSRFRNIKILNFSSAVHYVCNAFGLESRYFQYFQQPRSNISVPQQGLHGFFWVRQENQISVNTIFTLIGNTKFDSLHFHLAPDPGTCVYEVPSDDVCRRYNITISRWFEQKKDFEAVLDKANVFFAPRVEEGIGQAMLEAFTRGQCVVAPNCGTMNEYIKHGVNGLLYTSQNPVPLDFSEAIELGRSGYKMATQGFLDWKDCANDLVQFLLAPNEEFYNIKTSHIIKEYLKSFPFFVKLSRRVKAVAKFKTSQHS